MSDYWGVSKANLMKIQYFLTLQWITELLKIDNTTTKQLKVFQVITRKVSFPFEQHLQNHQFFRKLKMISHTKELGFDLSVWLFLFDGRLHIYWFKRSWQIMIY